MYCLTVPYDLYRSEVFSVFHPLVKLTEQILKWCWK